MKLSRASGMLTAAARIATALNVPVTVDAEAGYDVLQIPPAPSHAALADVGVARISYGGLLHHDAMEQFGRLLESLPGAPVDE